MGITNTFKAQENSNSKIKIDIMREKKKDEVYFCKVVIYLQFRIDFHEKNITRKGQIIICVPDTGEL